MKDAVEIPFRLRPVEPADEPFLFALYTGTRSDEIAAWGWPAEQQETFLRLQFAMRQRAHAAAYPAAIHSIIIASGERPLGALRVDRSPTAIHIVDIALLPEHRGAGLGGRILRGLQDEAARSSRRLSLQVAKNNRARQLYERLGLHVVDEDDVYARMQWLPPARG
jgi:ribosomal protein S18 acetylase RimI-like enzyme